MVSCHPLSTAHCINGECYNSKDAGWIVHKFDTQCGSNSAPSWLLFKVIMGQELQHQGKKYFVHSLTFYPWPPFENLVHETWCGSATWCFCQNWEMWNLENFYEFWLDFFGINGVVNAVTQMFSLYEQTSKSNCTFFVWLFLMSLLVVKIGVIHRPHCKWWKSMRSSGTGPYQLSPLTMTWGHKKMRHFHFSRTLTSSINL